MNVNFNRPHDATLLMIFTGGIHRVTQWRNESVDANAVTRAMQDSLRQVITDAELVSAVLAAGSVAVTYTGREVLDRCNAGFACTR